MTQKILTLILIALACPGYAQQISSADCARLHSIYGVAHSDCGPLPDQRTTNLLPIAPVDLEPIITEPTTEMRQNNIFFHKSGTKLDANAQLQIQKLANLLNAHDMQHVCLKLVGHSDTSGGNLINTEIGAKRALTVKNQLASLLRNPAQIESVQSMGEDSPLPRLNPESPWQRRVTLWARDCPQS